MILLCRRRRKKNITKHCKKWISSNDNKYVNFFLRGFNFERGNFYPGEGHFGASRGRLADWTYPAGTTGT